MKVLSVPGQAAVAGGTVNFVQLVRFGFTPPLCLNSSNMDFEFGGEVYKGAFGLGQISTIEDSPGEIKGLQFSLSGDSAELISLALDDSGIWQGTEVVLRNAILSDSYQILDAPKAWTGYGDTMSLQEEGQTATIQATAESSAVDLIRSSVLTYSDSDQKMLFPGDRGFEYVIPQTDKPVVWPTKEWFYR